MTDKTIVELRVTELPMVKELIQVLSDNVSDLPGPVINKLKQLMAIDDGLSKEAKKTT